MATLFVDKIDPQSGTALEIGSSGDTITIPSGATIVNSGTQTGFGGANTPAFAAKHFEVQGTAAATITKMLLQTEVFDTDSCYDAPNSKFIPNVAGKYYLYFKFGYESDYDHRSVRAMIYKNGSNISEKRFALSADYMDNFSSPLSFDTSAVVEANGTTDYFEAYFYIAQTGALKGANTNWTQFTGYKLIT